MTRLNLQNIKREIEDEYDDEYDEEDFVNKAPLCELLLVLASMQ